MTSTKLYYVTRFGSLAKRLTDFDAEGFADFLRVEDGERRNWHASDMREADAEDLRESGITA